ncbi:MAG: hypothetical protein ACE5NJ_01775 [Thermodesulfobacteriota bacterium]
MSFKWVRRMEEVIEWAIGKS